MSSAHKLYWSSAAVATLLYAAMPASAALLDDPLHGYCSGAGQCVDNGTNSPTTNNPPINFGFTISPGPNTGDLRIDILVPNNESSPSTFSLAGTFSGTATLFSATAWTSGQLDTYLGIGASPANPIGAFLPATQALDPGATGFFVYQVDLGTATLQDASNPNSSPLENITSGALPLASYIVGFLDIGEAAPDWVATANSGAIFVTTGGGGGGNFTPEPASLVLLGAAALAAGGLSRRRRRS